MRLKLKKVLPKPPDFPPKMQPEDFRQVDSVRLDRLVTLQVDIRIPGTVNEEEAEKLLRDALQIDCWVGEVQRIETVFIDTLP